MFFLKEKDWQLSRPKIFNHVAQSEIREGVSETQTKQTKPLDPQKDHRTLLDPQKDHQMLPRRLGRSLGPGKGQNKEVTTILIARLLENQAYPDVQVESRKARIKTQERKEELTKKGQE